MKPISSVQIDIETSWRGGQRQVELLCKGLAKRGHPVCLITRPRSILGEKLKASNVQVFEIAVGFEFDPVAASSIGKIIREKNPEVVGMHASHPHTLGILAKKFVASDPKYIVHRRVDFSPGSNFFHRWKYQAAPDGYIAISEAVKKVLVVSGVKAEKIEVVFSGVPIPQIPENARADLCSELGVPTHTPLIGNVASLSDHKGQTYLLNAIPKVVEKYPDALFLMVGDGELREKLIEQGKSLGIKSGNLRFLGYRDDVPKILGALDLFVMTSHKEGLCTSIIDAQLAKVPVVATAAGGIPELVFHENTGLLAKNRSAEDIAANIARVLGDPALGDRLAQNAFDRAEKELTDDAMVEGTLDAYTRFAR